MVTLFRLAVAISRAERAVAAALARAAGALSVLAFRVGMPAPPAAIGTRRLSLGDRLYGPAPPAVRRTARADFGAWARRERVLVLAIAWAIPLLLVWMLGDTPLITSAALTTYTLLALVGLHLLTVDTAQASIGQAGFIAVGAYLTAGLRLHAGFDGLTAAVVSMLAAATAGWILGIGTSRLRPASVALATWAFGWLVSVAIGAFPQISGGVAGITLGAPLRLRSAALGIALTFDPRGHLLLGTLLLLLTLMLVRSAQLSGIGRAWAAMRDSAAFASALGYNVPSLRRRAFATSAALAGLSGSLAAQLLGVVDPTRYTPVTSLALFAAVLIGSPFGLVGPFLGVFVVLGVPALANAASTAVGVPLDRVQDLVTAALVVAALALAIARREQVHAAVTRFLLRVEELLTRRPAADRNRAPVTPELEAPLTAGRGASGGRTVLSVRDLVRTFGGVRAVDGVSFDLTQGEVRGLIGPNGSGKSTLLKTITGTIRSESGHVHLDGVAVEHVSESRRVARGIARTFQRTVVLPGLTPEDHVLLGLHGHSAHSGWLRSLLKTPANRAESQSERATARAILTIFGLEDFASAPSTTLTAGRQRLLQAAAAVATNPAVLLLDEPSAGMTPDELELLARAVRRLAEMRLTIVLVEHNLRFLFGLAHSVTVLKEGRLLVTGTPDEVVAHPGVREAYLGAGAASTPPAAAAKTGGMRGLAA